MRDEIWRPQANRLYWMDVYYRQGRSGVEQGKVDASNRVMKKVRNE
jgi:hypothetical protein